MGGTISTVARKTAIIVLIAAFLILHLIALHGHEEAPSVEACLVVLVSVVASVALGGLPTRIKVGHPLVLLAAGATLSLGVPALLPTEMGMVMRR